MEHNATEITQNNGYFWNLYELKSFIKGGQREIKTFDPCFSQRNTNGLSQDIKS